jgi:hypothetical protein
MNLNREEQYRCINTAFEIMSRWDFSEEEKRQSLRLEDSCSLESIVIDEKLMLRISYILTIHSTLSNTFTSKYSIYGWITRQHKHNTSNTKSVRSLIISGKLENLEKAVSICSSLI